MSNGKKVFWYCESCLEPIYEDENYDFYPDDCIYVHRNSGCNTKESQDVQVEKN